MSQPTFKPFHRAWIEVTSSSSLVFWGPSLWKPSNTKSIIVEPICSSRSLYLMNDAQWTKTGKIVWLMFFKTIYVVIQTKWLHGFQSHKHITQKISLAEAKLKQKWLELSKTSIIFKPKLERSFAGMP